MGQLTESSVHPREIISGKRDFGALLSWPTSSLRSPTGELPEEQNSTSLPFEIRKLGIKVRAHYNDQGIISGVTVEKGGDAQKSYCIFIEFEGRFFRNSSIPVVQRGVALFTQEARLNFDYIKDQASESGEVVNVYVVPTDYQLDNGTKFSAKGSDAELVRFVKRNSGRLQDVRARFFATP